MATCAPAAFTLVRKLWGAGSSASLSNSLTLRFTVHRVTVANLFDLVENNMVATRWDVEVVNRDGRQGQNSGVTVTTLRGGKAVHIQDFIFDTGPAFRTAWSEA